MFVNFHKPRIESDPQHILCAYYNFDLKHQEKCNEKGTLWHKLIYEHSLNIILIY